jgi:hypothetical protein
MRWGETPSSRCASFGRRAGLWAWSWALIAVHAAGGQSPPSEPAAGAEAARTREPARLVEQARQLSQVTYYQELAEPIERGFGRAADGSIVLQKARFLTVVRQVWQQDEAGNKTLVHEQPIPGAADREQAAALYREVLASLSGARRAVTVPFEFLGVEVAGLHSDVMPEREAAVAAVQQAYAKQPSDLAALAYLELALIEKSLQHEQVYGQLLEEAVRQLNLEKLDFRGDLQFRRDLPEALNFARPEACLLYLAAGEAQAQGRDAEARARYTALVERMPGCPFAWEGLVGLRSSNADSAEQQRLHQSLMETWPLIWGCARPGFEDTPQARMAFAQELPGLLERLDSTQPGN